MLGAGDPVATIYGFRITGDYAGAAGMHLAFDNRFVTLDCGKAHINAPYAVENTASGFLVHVQNAGGAFLLSLAPDNITLTSINKLEPYLLARTLCENSHRS